MLRLHCAVATMPKEKCSPFEVLPGVLTDNLQNSELGHLMRTGGESWDKVAWSAQTVDKFLCMERSEQSAKNFDLRFLVQPANMPLEAMLYPSRGISLNLRRRGAPTRTTLSLGRRDVLREQVSSFGGEMSWQDREYASASYPMYLAKQHLTRPTRSHHQRRSTISTGECHWMGTKLTTTKDRSKKRRRVAGRKEDLADTHSAHRAAQNPSLRFQQTQISHTPTSDLSERIENIKSECRRCGVKSEPKVRFETE
jgi:hypothetical protein